MDDPFSGLYGLMRSAGAEAVPDVTVDYGAGEAEAMGKFPGAVTLNAVCLLYTLLQRALRQNNSTCLFCRFFQFV